MYDELKTYAVRAITSATKAAVNKACVCAVN
jgi:hypothetical protein